MWNTTVIVENRPGADGIVATTAVHNAPGDGYTLLMSTNALVITPHLKPLPYDPIKDFEPITIVGQEYHHMLVTPKLPAKTVKEFIDLAKSTPGGLTFSSAGPGSAPFLGMQRFMQASGITNMVHVPYPGSMPAAMALVTSDVQSMFSSPSTTLPLSSEGKIRVLAVAGPKARPQRSRRADLGGVGSAGVREQHLVRSGGVFQGSARRPEQDQDGCRSGHALSRRCSSASTTSNRSRSAIPQKSSAGSSCRISRSSGGSSPTRNREGLARPTPLYVDWRNARRWPSGPLNAAASSRCRRSSEARWQGCARTRLAALLISLDIEARRPARRTPVSVAAGSDNRDGSPQRAGTSHRAHE